MTYRFGPCELDRTERLLLRDGQQVSLTRASVSRLAGLAGLIHARDNDIALGAAMHLSHPSHPSHLSHLSHLICLCLMPLVLTGCGSTSGPSGLVPQGTWGGDHVELVLDAAHGALEFDCAHGAMQAPIPLAADGTFNVTGIFVREHGGPIRDGEPADQHPAVYSGNTDGKRMTLTVALSDESQQIGSFQLALGGSARVVKCL